MLPSDRYLTSLLAAAEAVHGGPLREGTTILADPEREGTGSATCYPTMNSSIVWCDAALLERLKSIESSSLTSAEEFVAAATELGGTLLGYGRIRVLDGPLLRPLSELGDLVVEHVGADDEPPMAMIDDLIAACDPDDVDDAELDREHLDPTFTVLVTPDRRIAAYASARVFDGEASFDDIAVLTRPEFRGRQLGALVVHEFVRRRRAEGRDIIYRCNVDNIASNHVAEALGFVLVATIGAVAFAAVEQYREPTGEEHDHGN